MSRKSGLDFCDNDMRQNKDLEPVQKEFESPESLVIPLCWELIRRIVMWTTKNRIKHNRDALRYPSDPTDAEWAHIEPLIPPARHGGRKRTVNIREIINGIMYLLSTGCQWRALPKGNS